jgi:hypothetical protein
MYTHNRAHVQVTRIDNEQALKTAELKKQRGSPAIIFVFVSARLQQFALEHGICLSLYYVDVCTCFRLICFNLLTLKVA